MNNLKLEHVGLLLTKRIKLGILLDSLIFWYKLYLQAIEICRNFDDSVRHISSKVVEFVNKYDRETRHIYFARKIYCIVEFHKNIVQRYQRLIQSADKLKALLDCRKVSAFIIGSTIDRLPLEELYNLHVPNFAWFDGDSVLIEGDFRLKDDADKLKIFLFSTSHAIEIFRERERRRHNAILAARVAAAAARSKSNTDDDDVNIKVNTTTPPPPTPPIKIKRPKTPPTPPTPPPPPPPPVVVKKEPVLQSFNEAFSQYTRFMKLSEEDN